MKFTIAALILSITACTTSEPLPIDKGHAQPGGVIHAGQDEIKLHPGSLRVGDDFAEVSGLTLESKGSVTLINVVPSIDTPVCEQQTHILGEDPNIHPSIQRVTISRDLPMAQKRFATLASLENITYLSDYKTGAFGKSTGLMMQDSALLARAVIVVDQQGKVAYLQLVPDVTHLPDMQAAIKVANQIAGVDGDGD